MLFLGITIRRYHPTRVLWKAQLQKYFCGGESLHIHYYFKHQGRKTNIYSDIASFDNVLIVYEETRNVLDLNVDLRGVKAMFKVDMCVLLWPRAKKCVPLLCI